MNVTDALRRACCRVEWGASVGAGFLVAEQRVLTCAHVLATDEPGGGAEPGDELAVTFPEDELIGRVVALSDEDDLALIQLGDDPRAARPLPLATRAAPVDARWTGLGFPAPMNGKALPLAGTVRDPRGEDDQDPPRPSMILYSDDLASGHAVARGFSGGPVVVDGAVVGQLRRVLRDAGMIANGIAFATPLPHPWLTQALEIEDPLADRRREAEQLKRAIERKKARGESAAAEIEQRKSIQRALRTAEGRWTSTDLAETDSQGMLLAVYRHVNEHTKVGIGYNFTEFNDDLTDLDYDADGFFFNVVVKY